MNQRLRLGRIVFKPNVKALNLFSYCIIALFSTCLIALINFIQPFLLTEFLNLPQAVQGAASGSLAFWNELVIIVMVGVFGSLSDRLGRPPIYAFGFFTMAIAYCLFPIASSLNELIVFRVIFAVGAAAVTAMLATVLADYPEEEGRGKFTGLIGILNGLGIMMIVFFFSKLPFWLQNTTTSAQDAGSQTFYIICAVSLAIALLAFTGLSWFKSEHNQDKGFKALFKEGLYAAKKPKIRLAYAAAFVSRGDLAIVGTFLSLWIIQDRSQQGMNTAEALKQAGMIFGISQGAALLWAPIIGIICDRKSRVFAMALALGLAAVGYCSLGFIDTPAGTAMIMASILLGIGEISAVIASQALIGEQSDSESRGAVVGWFGMFGAIGILISTKIGGFLFDNVHPSAPFTAIGILNGLVLIYACKVLWKSNANAEVPLSESPSRS